MALSCLNLKESRKALRVIERKCASRILFLFAAVLLTLNLPSRAELDTPPQIFLEGKPIIGMPVLSKSKNDWLIPVAPVARELGSQVEISADASTIRITRAQDGSTALYTPRTGEFIVNGIPSGSYIPEVPLNMVAEFLALPADLMAVLLGVTIQQGGDRIEISRAEIKSAVYVQPKENYKDFGFDYLQTEAGEYSLKLNPEVEGKPTHYAVVQNMYLGSGGHWGPLSFNGGSRVQGGTGRNFLTFNSANLQVRNLKTGLKLYGGDNPLSGFQSKQLNGYPGRGLLHNIPKKNWIFSGFNGLGFTQGIPVGGGTVRLSYERYLSANEVTWVPNSRFRASCGTVLFYDRHPFLDRTQQHGYYLQTLSAYQNAKSSILGEAFVGESRRSNLQKGGAYLIDIIGKHQFNRRFGILAEYDRISPHFAHPQIGNAFVNRSDAIVGGAATIAKWLQMNCNYSFNQSLLEARRPSRVQVINASWRISPFKNGPSINLLGSQTFFRPPIARNPSDALNLARAFAINILNQPFTQVLQQGAVGLNRSKSTLATVTIDHQVRGYSLSGGATTSVIKTQGQQKPTISNSITMSLGHNFGRLGDLQIMSQIGIFTTRTSTHTFDIRAIYKTPPLFGQTSLVFGPGYSRAGEFQRFTFITSLATNVPGVGSYSMNVNRQLAQTTSAGKYVRTVFLNKSRGRQALDTAAEGRVPPFGSITGIVIDSAEFPNRFPAKAPKLAGIKVILDGQEGIFRETGSDGKWSFNDIPAGRHRVSISVISTPASYSIVSPQTFYVQIWPGQTTQTCFSLAKMGQMKGTLKAADGVVIPHGQLGSVRVYLAERDIDTLSDVNGNFYLTDVPPGNYTIKLDSAFLPEDLVADPDAISVKLGSGQVLENVQFFIKKKERETTKRKM